MIHPKVILVPGELCAGSTLLPQLEAQGIHVLQIIEACNEVIPASLKLNAEALLVDIAHACSQTGASWLKAYRQNLSIPLILLCPSDRPEVLSTGDICLGHACLFTPLPDINTQLSLLLTPPPTYQSHLFIKRNRRYQRVPVADILYIQASGAYCVVVTKEADHTLAINLNAMDKALQNQKLVRVHRSYILNVDHIDGFEGHMLFVGDKMVPLSSSYEKHFAKVFPFIHQKGLVL